jgi:hypothetical protein
MTASRVAAVERLGVAERERVHPARHSFQLTDDDEVEVVAHQAEREQPPVRLDGCEAEEAEEAVAVVVVHEDVAAVDAAHREVIRAEGGQVVPSHPCHRPTVAAGPQPRIGGRGHAVPQHVPGTVPTM